MCISYQLGLLPARPAALHSSTAMLFRRTTQNLQSYLFLNIVVDPSEPVNVTWTLIVVRCHEGTILDRMVIPYRL